MSRIDIETKRKLREMGVATLLDAFDAQDNTLTLGLAFEEKIKLAVDDAHSAFTQTKVEGLIRRANLRYPNADLRRLDLVEERGLDRSVIAGLGTCSFIDRQQNVVFQGFTGSGKSYLGCALAKAACLHRVRAHYIRMPELEEAWQLARDKPAGTTKFLNKYTAFTLLVIDEWLLDEPDDSTRSMLLELLEQRYDQASTVFCTQYAQRDWRQRPVDRQEGGVWYQIARSEERDGLRDHQLAQAPHGVGVEEVGVVNENDWPVDGANLLEVTQNSTGGHARASQRLGEGEVWSVEQGTEGFAAGTHGSNDAHGLRRSLTQAPLDAVEQEGFTESERPKDHHAGF
ncbi:hypothetical protein CLE01_22260 [Cryobacterium levicorallinum]|uniref:DNA replication protein DnaC n=1 Tax=Cryobacterium levicorallinum TaxID=995038 RepID=A0ABY1EAG6_9MICO|nr:ATP-binding protein [Cryobacterium levicorallinum]GEP27628.1 hypothetical protein CLE01_22260 [Cryobacterium levicorallinum]SFH27442.1 DNA replication protein DnaC [Cryobacterium levicorallinum]